MQFHSELMGEVKIGVGFNPLCAGSSGAVSAAKCSAATATSSFNPLCAGSSGAVHEAAKATKVPAHVSIPYARGVAVQARHFLSAGLI